MDDQAAEGAAPRGNPFTVVPIEITISVGKARPLIRDLLKLTRDSVLPLDRRVDDPVELYVGDRLIARGELEELEGDQAGQLAVRLTEVSDLSGEL
ncbi:FliM/FliN family flagellar motor switch protein [Pseudooceanicola sediminis]|uniref:Flagellar motor switch protein FliN n=1 Tax=Pseudooceanicola sediminis TaxID=2211117 RepID=A0A399J481_9RHOB|nr:FliM/FliN family flagellar motor C-terminal domain-containing protein [Pseudooceanicola sediminis]KAA2315586.1 FliM/FliN family flagellar motor switch protein [Puniceibacterium sp. HSS470]RII40213.1 FliM/FliN family flagellar motor switch protein [Pseudooceanicola sediminis]|tara:strand:- start:773 stop:1060 length:288 start_codon:yes stop_codon:yes gene_type:complete